MGFTAAPGAQAREVPRDSFQSWVAGLPVHAAVGMRHGQWYAIARDFTVAGMGKTQDDALTDLSGLLEAYLRSFHVQGQPLESALRPVGTLTMLRLLLPLKQRKRVLLHPILH